MACWTSLMVTGDCSSCGTTVFIITSRFVFCRCSTWTLPAVRHFQSTIKGRSSWGSLECLQIVQQLSFQFCNFLMWVSEHVQKHLCNFLLEIDTKLSTPFWSYLNCVRRLQVVSRAVELYFDTCTDRSSPLIEKHPKQMSKFKNLADNR